MKHPLALLQAVDIPAFYSDELGLWGDSPRDVLGPIHKLPISWRSWDSC